MGSTLAHSILRVDPPSSSAPTVSFELLERLGAGGMADVHLVRMTREGDAELVALKRLRGDFAQHPDSLRQFAQEAKICSLLKHENIVGLRAFGHDRDGPYLALEYVEGSSAARLLKAMLAKGTQLPLIAAFSILR